MYRTKRIGRFSCATTGRPHSTSNPRHHHNNAHHYRPLNDVEKGQVIELDHLELSQGLIADRLGRTKSTVGAFLKRYHERGTTENSPAPGRPTKVTEQLKRRLPRHTKSNRRQPLAELRNEVAPGLSIRTVLRNENVRKWKAAKRPKLTKNRAAKRLAWAMTHADWTEEDFKSVLWSDECSVEKSKDPRTDWVFRTPYEKWDIDCVQTYEKGPGVKLMVWGCFGVIPRAPLSPSLSNHSITASTANFSSSASFRCYGE
jgi:hypothetical protein